MASPEVDVERTARVVMALVHGFLLQKVAFGLDDVSGFGDDVRAVLGGTGRFSIPSRRLNVIADGD
ncbi:hypothetical protein [Glaciihabitans sp. UYNi722]|uniref:hypothetical protein n=1 Tax=Glaciihabitans sp. UYNi722 TaxID=3156344 RepID=UPI0033965B18